MGGNKSKKQSTTASATTASSEASEDESGESGASAAESHPSHPVQESRQQHHDKLSCVYVSITQQPTSFGQPSKEQKEQNLAIQDTDQTQETTTSDSAYFTKSHPKKPAREKLPPVEQTTSNTHLYHPEASSAVLQNAVAVFNTPHVYDLHINSSPLQETLPSPPTLLNPTTLCFEEPRHAKIGPLLLLFLTLVGPETIDLPPVEPPPTKEIEYLTNEAVVTTTIPRQPIRPNPIAKEPRYAKLAPVIKPFDVGLSGPDPGGGQKTTSESFYDSEMAKYCTKDGDVKRQWAT